MDIFGNTINNATKVSYINNDSGLTAENVQAAIDELAASGGSGGDVVGPSSITDNAICRFDGTTGKLIQSSGITIADNDYLTMPANADIILSGTGRLSGLVTTSQVDSDTTLDLFSGSGAGIRIADTTGIILASTDGTVGAPNYSFSSHPETGLWTLYGELNITTCGTNVMTFGNEFVTGPPANMTGDTTDFGEGDWIASNSANRGGGYQPYHLFTDDVSIVGYWASGDFYDSGTGLPTGGFGTTTVTDVGTVNGEWVQIVAPAEQTIIRYTITQNTGALTRAPKSWSLVGKATADTNWTLIDAQTNQTFVADVDNVYPVAVSLRVPFDEYRIIFEKITIGDTHTTCFQLKLITNEPCGSVNIVDNVTMGGDLTIGGGLSIGGSVSLPSNLTVGGTTTLSGNAIISGFTTTADLTPTKIEISENGTTTAPVYSYSDYKTSGIYTNKGSISISSLGTTGLVVGANETFSPSADMTANSDVINGITFTATASSTRVGYQPYMGFSATSSPIYWASGDFYDSGTGLPSGGATTTVSGVGSVAGEWLKLQASTAQTVLKYYLYPRASNYYPTSWTLAGSNNDSTWTVIDSRTDITYTTADPKIYEVSSTASYEYFIIIIQKKVSAVSTSNCEVLNLKFVVAQEDVSITDDLTVEGNIRVSDGSVAAPSLSFANDSTTGLYGTSSSIRNVISGVQKIGISSTFISTTVPIEAPDGTAGAPSYTFGDQDLGMWSDGNSNVNFSVAGVEKMRITDTELKSYVPIELASYTTGALPTGADGQLAYDSTTGEAKVYQNSGWQVISTTTPDVGNFYIANATSTTLNGGNSTIPVAVLYTSVAGVSNTNFTLNTSTGVLTYTGSDTKIFSVCATLSFTGGTNTTYTFAVGKNGTTAVSGSTIQRKTANADVGALGISCLVSLATSDTIQLIVSADASNNPTVTYANFTATVL